MELNKVYKRIEVGIIPNDWGVHPLRKLSVFITKGSTPTTYGHKWQQQSGITFLRSECVSENGLDLTESMYISPEAHASFRRSEVREGDILMTITGNVGRVVLLEGVITGNINQHIARLRIIEAEANPSFVYHVLSQASIRKYYNSIVTGQAYPQISLKQVRETLIPLPPTNAEQATIADALNDADSLVQSITRLITKKRQIKQAAMQTLFNPYENCLLKRGWAIKKLGEICDVRDGTHDSPRYLNSGVKFITSKNIVNNKLDLSDVTYISRNDADEINKRSKVDRGDILMSMIGTIGNVVLINDEPDFCIKNVALLKSKRINPNFLVQYMGAPEFQLLLNNSLDGGIQKFVSLGVLRGLQIKIPVDKLEQERIANTFSDMDAEIAALEAKLSKYQKIKQGMMQNLLTGRIRLMRSEKSNIEVEAAA